MKEEVTNPDTERSSHWPGLHVTQNHGLKHIIVYPVTLLQMISVLMHAAHLLLPPPSMQYKKQTRVWA